MNITKYIEKALHKNNLLVIDSLVENNNAYDIQSVVVDIENLVNKSNYGSNVIVLSNKRFSYQKEWKETYFEFLDIEIPSVIDYKTVNENTYYFLYIDGLFYDIETPNGVSHWVELPFYKRLIEANMIELAKRFVKLEYILSRKKKPSYHDYNGEFAYERFSIDFKMFTDRVNENLERRVQGEKLYGEAFVKQVENRALRNGKATRC